MGRPKKVGRKRTLTRQQFRKKQNENTSQWRKVHTRSCNLCLHIENDKDIIEWLEQQPNKQQYLRELIRKDIKNNN